MTPALIPSIVMLDPFAPENEVMVPVVGVVGVVGVIDDVEIWRPANVFTAPARFAATPDASLMLAPLGRVTPVMASADVLVSVNATVVLKVSALVPEPPT